MAPCTSSTTASGCWAPTGSSGRARLSPSGAALSAKYRKTDQVAVCFFGDAAANQGAVHESMNLASVWKLPVVFVCENNQYAQFTPHSVDSSVADVYIRAKSYGMPGEMVDGMDVLAVYDRVGEAVQNARAGNGPSFIEAKTYRFFGHFEGDLQVYRTQTEVQEWQKRDPIHNLKVRMAQEGTLTDEQFVELDDEAREKVANAVKFAESSPDPLPEEFEEDVYVSYK